MGTGYLTKPYITSFHLSEPSRDSDPTFPERRISRQHGVSAAHARVIAELQGYCREARL